MSSFKSNGFDTGANEYIRTISNSVVAKCEVLQRGRDFQSNHQAFRKLAFGNRIILENVLELLYQLDHKNVRWDFVFELSMNEKEKLSEIKSLLPCVTRHIEAQLKRKLEPISEELRELIDSTRFRTAHLCRWTVDGLHQNTIDDRELTDSYRSYAQSKRNLASSCLMLVVKIAHQFRNSGSSLMELVQDGNVGVMVAAEKYDPQLGWTFSAYASHWIRRYIFIGLAQQSFVKVPHNKSVDFNRCVAAIGKLSQQLGRNINQQEQHELLTKNRLCESSFQSRRQPVSLSLYDERDESRIPMVAVASNPVDCPVNSLSRQELKSAVSELVGRLDDRERTILEMRFGLNGQADHSLASIARHTGLTHQRIHQIIARLKSELKAQLTGFC